MSVQLQHEDGSIFRLDVVGRLGSDQFARCQQELAGEIRARKAVRLLVVVQAFEGWEPGDGWRDLSFFVRHGDAIERIAFVAPDEWRSSLTMFAGVDLRRARVEFFEEGNVASARAWLAA